MPFYKLLNMVLWILTNKKKQLSHNQKVLCDCHLTMEEVQKLTEPSRIVFLIKEPLNIVDDYCNRPDHQGFSDFINSTSDVGKAKEVCNETLKSLNEKHYNDIKNSKYYWIERIENSTINETVKKVERHFGFIKSDLSTEETKQINCMSKK